MGKGVRPGEDFPSFFARLYKGSEFIAKANDPRVWKLVRENVYVFRVGKPREETFDFSPYFPAFDGLRPRVDREEAFAYKVYKARGGEFDFEPIDSVVTLEDL